MENKLYRDEQNKTIGGVCAGLSDYFNIDVSWIRVIFLIALFMSVGFPAYLIFWIVVPAKKPDFKPFADYTVPPPVQVPFAPIKKKPSNAAIVFGAVLVIMGTIFLLCQFDLIPDWEYWKLWPVIFIAIGVMLIFTSVNKKTRIDGTAPWEHTATTTDPNIDNPETL